MNKANVYQLMCVVNCLALVRLLYPILLKELRLSAIAKEWEVIAQKAVSEQWEPDLFLAELCELEANHRHESRLKRLLKESKLPVGKQLHQYDFDEI
jgi:DNA replication protein DnaC